MNYAFWFKYWLDFFISLLNYKILHFRLPSRPSVYHLGNDISLFFRSLSHDSVVIFENIILNIYMKHIPNIKNTDTIIDIGAHIGTFSIPLSIKHKNKIRIIAVEPDPSSFSLLKKNTDINGLKNIYCRKIAINYNNRILKLHINPLNRGDNSAIRKAIGNNHILVQSITLADLFKENMIEKVRVLKMDCEGLEADIINNCPSKIFDMVHTIIIETHPDCYTNTKFDNMIKVLNANKFNVHIISGLNIPILKTFYKIPLLVASRQ